MNDFPTQNLGYIPDVRPSDFLEGTLPYEVVLPSGDWRPYLPPGEPQYSTVADSMGCVSFSNNNVAEISLKQQGIDVNFSDRFLAKMSNTTPTGNSFGIVEDACRHFGRIQENEWPVPQSFNWDTFYTDIPQEVKNKAVFYQENYEFISADVATLQYHLKQSPLQIAIPLPHPNHAVVLVYIDGTTAYYFDSYPGSTNYLKTMDVGKIQAAMKLIIKPLTMTKKFIIQDGTKSGVLILEGFTGSASFADNPAHLQELKDAFGFTGTEKTVVVPQ